MSDNPHRGVQQVGTRADPRVERSLASLRHALGALMQQEPFADITVQQILDRAGVSRATFYSHYRNKDDVLLASFERMLASFVEAMDGALRPRGRLVPLTELGEHFVEAGAVFESLRGSGRLEGIWNLGTDHIAALIEQRLPADAVRRDERRLLARMLAGACMESLRWWLDLRQEPASELDARFHAFAARLLQASTRR